LDQARHRVKGRFALRCAAPLTRCLAGSKSKQRVCSKHVGLLQLRQMT
jgi:hypothetical protein